MWAGSAFRTAGPALVALAVTAAGCAPGAATAAAPPSVHWGPCADNASVECGSVAVPVDWAAPDGPAIDLAVARRAAADPARRLGTLVYAPAGPGSSGVDALTNQQVFDLLFTPEQAERFDIVSFDPRGVRRSHPVRCSAALVDALDMPVRGEREFRRFLDAQAALGGSCRELTGPVIDHLDSTDQARDLDALRAALGEERVNIYALSYGTVLGQMYAESFPERIRTMVLDATVDHSVGTERIHVTGARAAQESFEVVLGWCATSEACVLHGRDVRAIVADLYAKADAGELTHPTDPARTLDRGELAHEILDPLGNADVVETTNRIAALAGSPAPRSADQSAQGSSAATVPLPIYLYCADHRNSTRSYADLYRLRRLESAVAPDVRTSTHGVPLLCVNPPFETTNPPHELDVEDAPPILVTNSRYDASTPHENARRVAEQIGDAVLVTYDGLGHGAAVRGRCMRGLVTAYLVDGTMPPRGTHCPAEPLP